MPEPDAVVIRPLRSDEYASVCALWQAAGLPTRAAGRDSADAFARQLERNSTTYLAAELDGRLIGVVLGTHDGRRGWINRLAVDPAHRKRGVAKRLEQFTFSSSAGSAHGIIRSRNTRRCCDEGVFDRSTQACAGGR